MSRPYENNFPYTKYSAQLSNLGHIIRLYVADEEDIQNPETCHSIISKVIKIMDILIISNKVIEKREYKKYAPTWQDLHLYGVIKNNKSQLMEVSNKKSFSNSLVSIKNILDKWNDNLLLIKKDKEFSIKLAELFELLSDEVYKNDVSYRIMKSDKYKYIKDYPPITI